MKKKAAFTLPNLDVNRLIPGQSVDCVIIGFEHHQLKILTLSMKAAAELFALPGGFIFKDEDMDKAAIRVLKERTGIELPFLEQFKTFGSIGRRDVDTLVKNLKAIEADQQNLDWFSNRFISTGYFSFVDINQCELKPDYLSESIQWVPVEEIPTLIFDHNHMVETALNYIRNQINYLPIGINILPEKFTMKELQILYESILGRKLDRGNFQRKMLKLDIFNRHEKQLEGGAHKAPYLYSFDQEKYDQLLEKGFGFNY